MNKNDWDKGNIAPNDGRKITKDTDYVEDGNFQSVHEMRKAGLEGEELFGKNPDRNSAKFKAFARSHLSQYVGTNIYNIEFSKLNRDNFQKFQRYY